MSIISNASNLGGLVYPFLCDLEWSIVSSSVKVKLPNHEPTLRWVKDNKVCDLIVPGMDTEAFLTHTGLSFSMHKGAFVLSKRISRLMRPYRYYTFLSPSEVIIEHSAELETAVYDGAGLMSSDVLNRLAENLDTEHPHFEQHLAELKQLRRAEITIMTDKGQEKAHVLIVDDLAVDFVFPEGSTKREVTLSDRIFIGLHPVHAKNAMRIDVQSLINLYPFFQPEQLLGWLAQEAEYYLDRIRSGELEQIFAKLGRFAEAGDLSQFCHWWLAEFAVSGGSFTWFPGTIKAIGRQHINRILGAERKFRFPIPGARYYIFPADVGERNVQPGEVELDPVHATAWVSTADWKNYIVNVLGGCDGDDGVWCFPFTDYDGRRRILIWRSPNQLGEYIVLSPTADSYTVVWSTVHQDSSFPRMDSRQLPPRIDTMSYEYGQLERFTEPEVDSYSVAAMQPAIEQAKINRGGLGAYCNMLLLTKAVYGRLPHKLPARLEDVIDGSVKSFRDLSPVLAWVDFAASCIIASGHAVPRPLRRRIEVSLSDEEKDALRFTENHWIDTLVSATRHHIDMYRANLDALAATEALPPSELFTQGSAWIENGRQLRARYVHCIRTRFEDTDEQLLKIISHPLSLIGAAAGIFIDNRSDAVLWHPSVALLTVEALRYIGLIGEPIWTLEGAAVWYGERGETAVPVQLNGVWVNWLKVKGTYVSDRMSDIPKLVREQAKTRIAQLAATTFTGLQLHTRITENNRIAAYTEHGNLFGYVDRQHELNAARSSSWRIMHASAKDGNVTAVLLPM